MKKLIQSLLSIVLISVCIIGTPIVIGGCRAPSTPAAAHYYTLLDSWTVSKAAYDVWCERVVSGKVSKEKEQKVDKAWNAFRAAFLVASASSDLNKATPASLFVLQEDLLELIKSIQ